MLEDKIRVYGQKQKEMSVVSYWETRVLMFVSYWLMLMNGMKHQFVTVLCITLKMCIIELRLV